MADQGAGFGSGQQGNGGAPINIGTPDNWSKTFQNSGNWGSSVSSTLQNLNPLNVGHSNVTVTAPSGPTSGAPYQIGSPVANAPLIPGGAHSSFNTATAYDNNANKTQSDLMTQLAAQASGKNADGTPAVSLASQQLQQGEQANIAGTMAQLASQRGAANPLMQRQAMQQNAASQAATNQAAANARIQEQMNAQQTLSGVANNVANQGLTQRGQDIGIASQNTANDQAVNLANYQGTLSNFQLQAQLNAQQNANNAQLQQGYNTLGEQYAGLNVQGQGINAGVAENNAANSQKTLGGLIGAGGAVLGGMAAGGTGLFGGGGASAGEDVADAFAHGGMVGGGYVSGKAAVKGDSLKNDKVHVMLSPGEVVVPRTVVNAKDPVAAFKEFMKSVNKKPIAKTSNDEALKSVMAAQSKAKKGK